LLFIVFGLFLLANEQVSQKNSKAIAAAKADSLALDSLRFIWLADNPIDSVFRSRGFVDLSKHDSLFCIDQRYASTNNFTGKNLYGKIRGCWLHQLAADKLISAAKFLKESHSQYKILIYDAARPQKAQFELYAAACSLGSCNYVAVPWAGSLHNFGFSVDVGLADSFCVEQNLGTPFDSFDSLAQPRYEQLFLRQGRLDSTAWERRKVLRAAMRHGGFRRIDLEWWHFNALHRDTIRKYYKIVP